MSSLVSLKKYGSGKTTLICFPGWLHPLEKEPKFLKLLSKDYAVISVHPPGYMNNADAASFANFSVLARDIHASLQKIKSGKKVFVGFSLGCRLIMELEKQFPSRNKKIFVGCPIGEYTVPFWARPLLSNKLLLSYLRKSSLIKKSVVTKALRKLGSSSAVFREKFVSLSGAFDSLIALLKSKTDASMYISTSLFIYGEKDMYTPLAQQYSPKNMVILEGAEHNCVRDREKEVVEYITNFLKEN